MSAVTLHHGDSLDVLRTLPDASVDAIVTDPPYGLAEHKPAVVTAALVAWCSGDRDHVPDGRGFMGRAWDAFVPPPAVWDECLRVLKPGGHLLAFAGSRTADLMGLSVRLAGFEIRDTITWHYASGFPKSLDVSKAIDKAAGATREVVGVHARPAGNKAGGASLNMSVVGMPDTADITAPATDAARQWSGWGTALKPASEPIIVARKPLTGTVAANVLAHGAGALNVDGCRVESGDKLVRPSILRTDNEVLGKGLGAGVQDEPSGRWPANVVLTHAPCCGEECAPGCPVAELDAQSGTSKSVQGSARGGGRTASSDYRMRDQGRDSGYGDTGGASRFFATFRYQAKAPTAERPKVDGVTHPTVKPLALMRWLVRLVTPPGGTVLDPFAGSGTTLQAARDEGFASIGVEREPTFLPLIAARLGVELVDLLAEEIPAAAIEPAESPEQVIADPVLIAIHNAPAHRPTLLALWREHEHVWTDVHTAAVKARLSEKSR